MIDEKNEPSAGSATLFQMLARGLTCPDAAMVEAIEDGSFAAEVGELLACMPFSESLAERVERSLEDLSCTIGDPDFLGGLRREYTRLFSAPRGALVPPWETLFLNADEDAPEFGSVLIRSKEAADARNRYEAAGISLALQESADHMRLECEFAGYLCSRLAQAMQPESRQVWARHLDGFVHAHLDRWFAAFFDTLAANARHPFYRTIAALGESVELDACRC